MIELALDGGTEHELRAKAAQMDLSVGAYLEHLLARQGAMPEIYEPSAELVEWRRQAVKSILSLRSDSNAPTLNLPEGVSLRDYMHADHQF